MTVKINADTSDGLKLESDTSGEVDIQSNGTTALNISSAGKVTSTSTGAGSNFEIQSTSGSSVGADLTLYQNSSSPADSDICGLISFAGNDEGGTKNTYAQIRGSAIDVSDSTEDGMIQFFTQQNGTLEEKMRITESARVGINTTSVQGTLHVDSEFDGTFGRACIAATTADPTVNSANQLLVLAFTGDGDITSGGTAGTYISFRDSGGQIGTIDGASTSSVVYGTSSDYRQKENVNYTFDATSRLKQLKPARFNFKRKPGVTVDGFLAHEVSDIVPQAIVGTKDQTKEAKNVVKNADGDMIHENVTETEWTQGKTDGTYANDTTWSATATIPVYQSIDHSKLVPLLVKTIQELEARITALES